MSDAEFWRAAAWRLAAALDSASERLARAGLLQARDGSCEFRELRPVALETKRAAPEVAEDGTFTGYGSVFNEPHPTSAWDLAWDGDWNDIMAPGAFANTLAQHKSRGTLPAMLFQHNMDEPIGAWTSMQEKERGLYVEGRLAVKTQKGAETYELMKIGGLRGLSIGFIARKYQLDKDAKLRTITEVELWEVSPVAIPADPLALVTDVKGRRPA